MKLKKVRQKYYEGCLIKRKSNGYHYEIKELCLTDGNSTSNKFFIINVHDENDYYILSESMEDSKGWELIEPETESNLIIDKSVLDPDKTEKAKELEEAYKAGQNKGYKEGYLDGQKVGNKMLYDQGRFDALAETLNENSLKEVEKQNLLEKEKLNFLKAMRAADLGFTVKSPSGRMYNAFEGYLCEVGLIGINVLSIDDMLGKWTIKREENE